MKFEIIAIGEEKPDFVSSRIQKALGTDYSHVAILVDEEVIYHATGKGFHKEYLCDVLPGHIIRHRFEVRSARSDEFSLGWLEGNIGVPYSNLQYLGFIFPWMRKFVDNGRKRTICSEAVGDAMQECFGYLIDDTDFKSPKDIVEILR